MRIYKFHQKELDLVRLKFLTAKIKTGDSGIYCIYNTVTHKFYIGSSGDLISRRSAHFVGLYENSHPNQYLQHSWNKYGPQAFVFVVLELITGENFLIEREQFNLDFYRVYERDIGITYLKKPG